jgi:hypothetical protein
MIKTVLADLRDVYCFSLADYLREWVSVAIDPRVSHWSKDRILKDKPLSELALPGRLVDGFAFRDFTVQLNPDMTPRDVLIAAGTFLRSFDEDVFCKALGAKIQSIEDKHNAVVVIDDLRFDNELCWLKRFEYQSDHLYTVNIVHIDRLDVDLASRDFNDYISYEHCDLMYVPTTYDAPLLHDAAIDEVRLFLGETIGVSQALEYACMFMNEDE